MFSIIDSAGPSAGRARNTAADRACDQCKQRKVRCDMGKPCRTCSERSLECTFDKARKKRGPAGKRLSVMRRHQVDGSQTGGPASSKESESEASRPGDVSPSFHTEAFDFAPPSTASLNSLMLSEHLSPQLGQWTSETTQHDPSEPVSNNQEAVNCPDIHSNAPARSVGQSQAGSLPDTAITPAESEIMFPSLPVWSPSDPLDTFASFSQEALTVAPTDDVWPRNVNEESLLPWINVYFKRLHPTMPFLNRGNLFHAMLLRKHHTNPQFGAMLLGLAAFAMTQPIQIHERASTPSRSAQARMLMGESAKMRVDVAFGQNPSIEMILTSFFMFACLFDSQQHKAARLRLREAIDLANSLGLHSPQSYDNLDGETKEQWLRTYLVLSVTER